MILRAISRHTRRYRRLRKLKADPTCTHPHHWNELIEALGLDMYPERNVK